MRFKAGTTVLAICLLGAMSACGGASTDTSSSPVGSSQDSTTTTVAAAAKPAAPDASPYVEGFGDLSAVSFPAGDPGAVTVVEAGETIDRRGSVYVIVRNNTSDDVGLINIAGTARDDAGKLVESGSSQGLQPAVVAPGEIAYGYVYFDVDKAGTAYEFKFDVDAQPAWEVILPATITELNHTGDQIVGAVLNDLDVEVGFPIEARVICFDTDGNVIDDFGANVEQDDLPAGGTGSFAIDLLDYPCPVGLVAASGTGSRP